MREFQLQRSMLREVVTKRPPVAAGMAALLRRASQARGASAWRRCLNIDWRRAERRWIAWFDRLLTRVPPPSDTELLWFESASDLNPASTSVSAYRTLRTKREDYGLDAARTWPESDVGETLDEGLLDLPELEEAWRRVGWRDNPADALRPGVYATASCLAALLVINGLPRTRVFNHLKDERGVSVVLGWVEGGVDAVGQLTSNGWGPVRRVKGSPPDAEVLDISSYRFDVERYIASGSDVNIFEPETGQSLLAKCWAYPPRVIRVLLDAGADPSVRNRDGSSVLHRFGASDLVTLRRLIAAGADPKAVNREGWSVLDRVANDGRCTLKHLEFYWKRGARPRRMLKTIDSPMHAVAWRSAGDAITRREIGRILRFWIRRGFSINHRRRDGLAPLWLSLTNHLTEQAEHLKLERSRGYSVGEWDLGHDRTAEVLLAHGADPNSRYSGPPRADIPKGATPLMTRRYDDDRLVRALLRHGADPHLTCAAGRTALDYARRAARSPTRIDRAGAEEVVAVLERAMYTTTRTARGRSSR